MKTFLATLALMLLTTQAFATDAKVVASLADVSNKISTITVDENGVLAVSLRRTGKDVLLQLSEENTGRLNWLANALKRAPLVTDHHDLVCMMLLFHKPALSVAGIDGGLREVLSLHSCALYDFIHPASANALEEAVELKTSLVVLASELTAMYE